VITALQLPQKGWITKVMHPLYHHPYGSTLRIGQVLLISFLLS